MENVIVSEKPSLSSRLSSHLHEWGRLIAALVALVVVAIAVSFIPAPYVVLSPGPTVDVLGAQGDADVLEVGDVPSDLDLVVRESRDDDGQLRMVTVSERGGPGNTVRVKDVVLGWLSPGFSVKAYSDVYPEEVTADEVKEMSNAQMQSSHSTASIAAFDYLGVPLETNLKVVGTVPDSGSEGVLEEGDILRSITTPDGTVYPVDSPSVPFVLLKTVPAGSALQVQVERNGKNETVEVVTTSPPTQGEDAPAAEGSKMGAYLDADVDSPLDVAIHLERIGGPSAGLAFALGIVDLFSPTDITGGEVVAATGALDYAADVTPVGGVKQKMHAAKRDGATWFLVPYLNCPDVKGNVPSGLTVVPVSTFREGLAALNKIEAGDLEGLPACPA